MRQQLAAADRLFMDETSAPVLDPGRGQTKKGFFWAIASDDRRRGGTSPPIVLFRYAPGRSDAFAEQFLCALTRAAGRVSRGDWQADACRRLLRRAKPCLR